MPRITITRERGRVYVTRYITNCNSQQERKPNAETAAQVRTETPEPAASSAGRGRVIAIDCWRK